MAASTNESPKKYALLSHESAVEAIWALAARGWQGTLDDEDIWLVPAAENCIRTQGDLAELRTVVDFDSYGILRRPVDLLVPNKSCYSRGKEAVFHVWKEFFPPHSFVRIHDQVLVSTPYFAALQLAMACRSNRLSKEAAQASAEEEARLRRELGIGGEPSSAKDLARWDNIARIVRSAQVLSDFMGTYRYVPSDPTKKSNEPSVTFGTKPIITTDAFDKYLVDMGSVRGIVRAREVAALAFAGAASPMETLLALMLTLPPRMGGFGLPRPQLNSDIPIDPTKRELLSQDALCADLCWTEQKVILEYYGWDEHFDAGPKKVAKDTSRANTLTALGWTVLHTTYEQVRTFAGISLLARQLSSILGTPLPETSDLELIWRSRILALLLPRTSQSL